MRIRRTVSTAIFLAALYFSAGCSTLPTGDPQGPTPTAYQIRKAKQDHKETNPECAVCGVKPTFLPRANEAHHIIPEHVDMTRAADPDNFVTLCRIHHWWVAHLKNWKDWNTNVEQTIKAMKAAMARTARSGKP